MTFLDARRALGWAFVLTTFPLLGACGGGSSNGSEKTPSRAISEFDASLDAGTGPSARLHLAIAREPESTRRAALEKVGAEDADVRLAALYALAATLEPGDADALAGALESAEPAERVLAAAGLLDLGDGRAVPVLIEALGHDEPLPVGFPRPRTWEHARFALLQNTGQDFGLRNARTMDQARATAAAWKRWWTDAASSFEIVRTEDPLAP
jgi:hypothetical protein